MKLKTLSLLIALLAIPSHATEVKLSQLPLGSAASTGPGDSFPFVDSTTGTTKRMFLFDIKNIPNLNGALTLSPSNPFGVIANVSGSSLTSIVPDPSSSKVFVSGGASAFPTWQFLTNNNLSGSAGITNANLAQMPNDTVKANIAGVGASPSDVALVSTNVPNSVVLRDSSGNFAAGVITGTWGGATIPVANGGTGVTSLSNFTDTSSGADGISVTGGTGAVIRSTSISQQKADSTHNGYLSAADFASFSTGSNPMTTLGDTIYGGAAGAETRLAGSVSSTKKFLTQTGTGLVSAAPGWNTIVSGDISPLFANLTDAGTDGITVTNGTGAVFGSGTSLAQHVADTTHNGYLSSTDWNTFNNKQATVSFTAFGSSPNSAGAVISGGAITLEPADVSNPGGVSTSAQTFAGIKTFNSVPVVGTKSQGDSSTNAASTAYVDTAVANAVSGVNPAVAVQVATTAAGNTSTWTYNNGMSGIGATFTGPINTAITIDGFTFTTLGQRLLIKDDTQAPSGAFNGVYYLSALQTVGTGAVFMRSSDFDTPSNINNTGAIPVVNGTVNATTSWVVTSAVATVGTDPITFTRFTRNPADYLLKTNNLSDVASVSTSFNNISPVTSTGDIIVGNGASSNTRLAKGSQYQTLQATPTTIAYDAVHLDQTAAITGTLPNSNTTATSSNVASTIVSRDGSGNFSANSVTVGGLTLSGFTTGAVPFIGGSGVITQNPSNFFWDNTNDRLGIATNAPSCPLDVTSNGAGPTIVARLNDADSSSTSEGRLVFSEGGNFYQGISGSYNSGGATGPYLGFSVNGTPNTWSEKMRLTADGLLGVSGGLTPKGILDVDNPNGAATNWSYLRANAGGNPPSASVTFGLMTAWNRSGGNGESTVLYGTGIGGAPYLEFGRWNGTTVTSDMALNAGSVGIGTISPSATLDVIGTIRSSVLASSHVIFTNSSKQLTTSGTVGVSSGGTGTALQMQQGSVVFAGVNGVYNEDINQLFWDATNHRLGIGTGTPAQPLEVKGNVNIDGSSSGVITIQPQAASGTYNFNLPTSAGTSGYVLQSQGGGSSAMVWSPVYSGLNIINMGLSTSVGSNLLTVNLKQSDGSTDASSTNPVSIGFRTSTLTSGGFNTRNVTGSLSINTVATGASFGLTSAVNQYIYVYALDNAGTVELALAGSNSFDSNTLYSTTAIGAGSTNRNVLYSTTARTNVPIRLLGRVVVNEATIGTYATAPSEVDLWPFNFGSPNGSVNLNTFSAYASTNTFNVRFTTNSSTGSDLTYNASSTLGDNITVNTDGIYAVSFYQGSALGNMEGTCITKNTSSNTACPSYSASQLLALSASLSNGGNTSVSSSSFVGRLAAGDVLRFGTYKATTPSGSSNSQVFAYKLAN